MRSVTVAMRSAVAKVIYSGALVFGQMTDTRSISTSCYNIIIISLKMCFPDEKFVYLSHNPDLFLNEFFTCRSEYIYLSKWINEKRLKTFTVFKKKTKI